MLKNSKGGFAGINNGFNILAGKETEEELMAYSVEEFYGYNHRNNKELIDILVKKLHQHIALGLNPLSFYYYLSENVKENPRYLLPEKEEKLKSIRTFRTGRKNNRWKKYYGKNDWMNYVSPDWKQEKSEIAQRNSDYKLLRRMFSQLIETLKQREIENAGNINWPECSTIVVINLLTNDRQFYNKRTEAAERFNIDGSTITTSARLKSILLKHYFVIVRQK